VQVQEHLRVSLRCMGVISGFTVQLRIFLAFRLFSQTTCTDIEGYLDAENRMVRGSRWPPSLIAVTVVSPQCGRYEKRQGFEREVPRLGDRHSTPRMCADRHRHGWRHSV
jgi:hypothetical protein